LAKSYTMSWTSRAYDALPGNPIWIGAFFAIGLLIVFIVGRAIFGGADEAASNDLRIAITQILNNRILRNSLCLCAHGGVPINT